MASDVFLAGVLTEGRFKMVILSDKLEGMAEYKQFEVLEVGRFIDQVLADAERGNRAIAAYSQIEKNLILKHRPGASFRYLNMAKASKAWIRKMHFNEFRALKTYQPEARNRQVKNATWALNNVAGFAGYPPPPMYARGKVTAWINTVADALKRHSGHFEKLTPVQKGTATMLINHNKFDVEAISHLYNHISQEYPDAIRQSLGKVTPEPSPRKKPSRGKRDAAGLGNARFHRQKLSPDDMNSSAIRAALDAIHKAGGLWEISATIALPDNVKHEPLLQRLEKAVSASRSKTG